MKVSERRCSRCGGTFLYSGRGRPPKKCTACRTRVDAAKADAQWAAALRNTLR